MPIRAELNIGYLPETKAGVQRQGRPRKQVSSVLLTVCVAGAVASFVSVYHERALCRKTDTMHRYVAVLSNVSYIA